MESNFSQATYYYTAYYLSTGKGKNLLLLTTCKEEEQLIEAKTILDTMRNSMERLPYTSWIEDMPDIIESDAENETESEERNFVIEKEFQIRDVSDYYHIFVKYSDLKANILDAYILREDGAPYKPMEYDGPGFQDGFVYWKLTQPAFGTYTVHIESDRELGLSFVEFYPDEKFKALYETEHAVPADEIESLEVETEKIQEE